MRLTTLRLLLFLALLNPQVMQADDPDAGVEARLRQALRDTVGQLRDAQSQLAALQAAQAQSDKEKADLQAKVAALTSQLKSVSDQAASDKAAADKTISDLKLGNETLIVHMVDALTVQINKLGKPDEKNEIELHRTIADLKGQNPDSGDALDQFGADIQSWVTGYNEYVQLANRTEAERARLAALNLQLERTVADRETKNVALYQLADEILTRYAKGGIGDALLDKEPFIGLSRVKLQNLVQDYKNKLRDQVVVPSAPSAGAQPAVSNEPATLSAR